MRIRSCCLRLRGLPLCLLLFPLLGFGQEDRIRQLPPGDRWISHMVDELLPFWSSPSALGDPVGAFPSLRCDDGSLVDFARPCPEVQRNSWLNHNARFLVSESRQTFAYGVAFHLTGDPKYLEYMKAGVDYIRNNFIDRQNGGMFEQLDIDKNVWGPTAALRDPQQLGYGLLGLAFYYYLTRDPAVLQDLLSLKDYIFNAYYDPSLGALQWQLESGNGARFDEMHLVAQLDQMNTYLILLTPILPEPYQSDWKRTIQAVARIMIDKFYSPSSRLLFLNANSNADTDLARSGTDFGHNAKGLWMIRFAALLTGSQELAQFAENNAAGILARAWIDDCGCWAEGLNPGGSLDVNKSWWIYAELDQFAATLALRDPAYARYLTRSYDYWFRYFVDHQFGEVWNGVDAKTNLAIRDLPKQWQWKNAYHDFEHVLVSYIATQQLKGEPVRLYYSFPVLPDDPAQIRPYYFEGEIGGTIRWDDSSLNPIWGIDFYNVR